MLINRLFNNIDQFIDFLLKEEFRYPDYVNKMCQNKCNCFPATGGICIDDCYHIKYITKNPRESPALQCWDESRPFNSILYILNIRYIINVLIKKIFEIIKSI